MKSGFDRFDLESEMTNTSLIIQDLELFRESFDLRDQEDNFILGLITIYDKRHEKLMSIFEEMVHERKV
jgi:hypothetical protein